MRVLRDLLEVEIRNANGDASYNQDQICLRDHVFVNQAYFPYFGLMARNTNETVNDIDISAIYVKNLDESRYQDKQALLEERVQYLIRKHEGG